MAGLKRISLKMDDESVVADSLAALKSEAKEKFKLTATDIRVRLEDGTIVEDEDYFSSLDSSTHLIITVADAAGKGAGDAVDGALASASFTSLSEDVTDINYLMSRLRDNMANLVSFTEAQLEVIVEGDTKQLQNGLHLTRQEADGLQEACHSHLFERQKVADAVEVLKLFNDHMSKMDQTDSAKSPSKRTKAGRSSKKKKDEPLPVRRNLRSSGKVHAVKTK